MIIGILILNLYVIKLTTFIGTECIQYHRSSLQICYVLLVRNLEYGDFLLHYGAYHFLAEGNILCHFSEQYVVYDIKLFHGFSCFFTKLLQQSILRILFSSECFYIGDPSPVTVYHI